MSEDYSEWEEIPAKDLWLNDEKSFVSMVFIKVHVEKKWKIIRKKMEVKITDYKEYWEKVDCIKIYNKNLKDGSYYKASRKFGKMFFSKGYDENTPMIEMLEREEKTMIEFLSKETQYLESKGVIKVIFI